MLRCATHIVAGIALLSGTATAQELDGSTLKQLFDGTQDALNSLSIEADFQSPESSIDETEVESGGETELPDDEISFENRQLITNAANILMMSGSVVERATQVSTGEQYTRNRYQDLQLAPLDGAVVQLGENLSNVIIANRVEGIMQQFGPGAIQSVDNDLATRANGTNLNQIGRNTANIATAEISIGSGDQVFPFESTQQISNSIRIVSDFAQISGSPEIESQNFELVSEPSSLSRLSGTEIIEQEGFNIGNILLAEEVHDVTREFTGEQRITNTIVIEDSRILPQSVTQTGINIANFVSATTVSGLQQVSGGEQSVENHVVDTSLASLTEALPSYTHIAENYVNVLHVKGTNDTTQLASTVVDALQANVVPQQSETSIGRQIQVGNVVVVER